MSDLNRQIAELLGLRLEIGPKWNNPFLGEWWLMDGDEQKIRACLWRPDTDANQIDAAVMEWGTPRVGPSGWRRNAYINALMTEIDSGADWDLVNATPKQKCRALIAAAKEVLNEA